jgi:patatin-like phospholipase/acyl hydrolase
MTIKHLVLPGGGVNLAILYGVVKELNTQQYWNITDIQSVHGSSCGSMIGLLIMLCKLGLEWSSIDTYFINRPWNKLFEVTPDVLITAYKDKGLVDKQQFINTFGSLMRAVNISVSITLKELYLLTNINFYIYATNLTTMELCPLHHTTHATLDVLSAINMSSALPPIIQPVYYNTDYYIDGGFILNNPIKPAIDIADNENEVLTFKMLFNKYQHEKLTQDSNIIEYLTQLSYKLTIEYCKSPTIVVSNEVPLEYKSSFDPELWNKIVYDSSFRREQIKIGETTAYNYIHNKE